MDLTTLTLLLLAVVPAVVQLLKRVFPQTTDLGIQALVALVSLVGVMLVEASANPFLSVTDFVLRLGGIYLAAQVVYDKVYALVIPKVSALLSGQK